MSIFYKLTYEINLANPNSNYIQAITKYNAEVDILKANGKDIRFITREGKDIPLLIEQAKKEGFTHLKLQCHTSGELTLQKIFPQLKPAMLDPALECLKENKKADALMAKTKILDYIKEVQHAHDRGSEETTLPSLSYKQALFLINNIRSQLEIGCINMPSINTILFQWSNYNFVLSYGENSSIVEMPSICLDLDDGFVAKYPEKLSNLITKELQKFFFAWKNKDYEGEVITNTQAQITFGKEEITRAIRILYQGFKQKNSLFTKIGPQITQEITAFLGAGLSEREALEVAKSNFCSPK